MIPPWFLSFGSHFPSLSPRTGDSHPARGDRQAGLLFTILKIINNIIPKRKPSQKVISLSPIPEHDIDPVLVTVEGHFVPILHLLILGQDLIQALE